MPAQIPPASETPPSEPPAKLPLADRLLEGEVAVQRRNGILLALAAQVAVYDLSAESGFTPLKESPHAPRISARDRALGTDLYAGILAAGYRVSRLPKHRVVGYSKYHVHVATGYEAASRAWSPDWLTPNRWRDIHSAAYKTAAAHLNIPGTAKEAARFLRHAPQRVAALAFEGCEFKDGLLVWPDTEEARQKPGSKDKQSKAPVERRAMLTEFGLVVATVVHSSGATYRDRGLIPMTTTDPWYTDRLSNRPPRAAEQAPIEDHVVAAVNEERSGHATAENPWWEGYASAASY